MSVATEHPRTAKIFGEEDELIGTKFAERAGVAFSTVYRWIIHGRNGYRLPAERFGGRTRITRRDFDRWHKLVNADFEPVGGLN